MNRCRLRDIDVQTGIFPVGSNNAITDVPGVLAGHSTIAEGRARTGVTVILPHSGNLFREKARAGCHVQNGFGKSTGLHQIRELGVIETPIALTNTLNVPIVADALIDHSLAQCPEIGMTTGTVNPVVGDINDGFLNDIRGRHVRRDHVAGAIAAALASGPGSPVAEGNVGGGTGASCLGFKGGIGTSSRVLPERMGGWRLGVLAQTNFGGMLSVNGAPAGRELGVFDFGPPAVSRDGSCMIVIATDAPLDSRLLARLARRAGLGMARTGFYSSNGSGDFFIAFSTAGTVPHEGPRVRDLQVVSDDAMSGLFAALVEAVEEAVLNSLTAADTMVGRDGNRREALPLDDLVRILDKYRARGWGRDLPGLPG